MAPWAGRLAPDGREARSRHCSSLRRDIWGRWELSGRGTAKKMRTKRCCSSIKRSKAASNLIGGANKEDYHLKNITPGKNFHPTAYVDLRAVTAGEACPNCGKAAAHRYGGRDRAHLQAGLSLFGVDGSARAR